MKRLLKGGRSLLVFFAWMMIYVPPGSTMEKTQHKLPISSSAFADGASIPSDHTCEGADLSPPLVWSGVPSNAKSLALIVDDPDAPAGDWVHWILYDMPPHVTQLPMGITPSEKLSTGGCQGHTDFGWTGYGGPCPPKGTHRYFFKLYALDAMLGLKPGATKEELLEAMQGHILAEGQLMGKYRRG